jgi:4'-phosphopantetheinyl transferase
MAVSAEGAWAPGPASPLLTKGAVHVWRADLQDAADELDAALSSDERARAQRFADPRHGRQWRRSRGVLRALLGRYLDERPSALRFAAGAHGKPELIDAQLSFNLSHSGTVALYAVSAAGAVGVDVELPRRRIDVLGVAARTFGPDEAQRLQALDDEAREREFLRAWVRHEAELKCLGVGLGGAGVGLRAAADAIDAPTRPWIAALEVGGRGAGAVAVAAAPRELRCWDWPGAARRTTTTGS